MKKYHIFLTLFFIMLFSFVYAGHEPTQVFSPNSEMIPNYSNFLFGYTDGNNMLLGNDAAFFGGYTDDCLIYSPTNDISDTLHMDYFVGGSHDGPFFEHLSYDQLFMGSVIISENGIAQSGDRYYYAFNHTHFTKIFLNQNQEFDIAGNHNPTFRSLGYDPNPYLDRHFEPHFPIVGTIETYLRTDNGAGLSISQRVATFPSDNWNNVQTLHDLTGGTFNVTQANPADLENVIVKNYTITNNTDQDKEIYVTQRLDTAINSLWDTYTHKIQIGAYDIYFYITKNNGEFDNYAGFQEPVSGIANEGYFGYVYDKSYGDTYTGMALKLLGNDGAPTSFRIIQYKPSEAVITNTISYTNRLVKYGIRPINDNNDPYSLYQLFLKPYNPMTYFDNSQYYNDFVSPGTFDSDATASGNYAIAITGGPYTVKAGRSINVSFAIALAVGSSKEDMISKLDQELRDAKSIGSGFASKDLEPPTQPKYKTIYEKYDVASDTVMLTLKWEPQDLTFNDSPALDTGAGYNLYMTTGYQQKDLKLNRINYNNSGEYCQLFGSLKGAPTSYDIYTSTSWSIESSKLSQHDSYLFALTGNDEKWYREYISTPADSNYFNESDPTIAQVYLVPTPVDTKCKFAFKDNSNYIKVYFDAPPAFEKDLDYYSIMRDKISGNYEVEKVYLQGGVYKEIKNLTEPLPIKLFLNGNEYTIKTNDIIFNLNDALDDVFINTNGIKMIVSNFYLQKYSETSPFTISETDTTPIPYALTLDSYKIDAYEDENSHLIYWAKHDDYGNTYYQVSNGNTVNSYPSTCKLVQVDYAVGTPNSIIDYTELDGDTVYYYNVLKYDILGNHSAKQGAYSINTKPNYPKNLKAVNKNKTIELTWDAATGDIFRYYIYRCSTKAILSSKDPINEDYIEKIGGVDAISGATYYTFVDTYINNYSTYYYFVTSYNRETNMESKPSNIAYVIKEFDYETNLSKAHAVPNPYFYGSRDALKENGDIVFINLTPKAVIYIYSLRGNLIKKIEHSEASPTAYGSGAERWDLTNSKGNKLATGLYFYIIKNPDNKDDIKKGKIAIVR